MIALLVCAIAEPAAPVRAQQARRPRSLPVESMDPYRDAASRLIGAALADRFAWERLAELTDTIGHRLSGSAQLERAVQWARSSLAGEHDDAFAHELQARYSLAYIWSSMKLWRGGRWRLGQDRRDPAGSALISRSPSRR